MGNFQNFVEGRVGVVACRLAPVSDQIDSSGRDREDYRSLLILRILENVESVDTLNDTHKEKWVNLVLRNKATDYRREKKTATKLFLRTGGISKTPGPQQGLVRREPEDQIVQKELLKRLHTCLAASDWSLLIAYLEHGTVRDTWRASGVEITERAFGRRLRKVIERCREIIQKITQ